MTFSTPLELSSVLFSTKAAENRSCMKLSLVPVSEPKKFAIKNPGP